MHGGPFLLGTERKTLTLELKQDEADAEAGRFRAIFSTFNTIDHDGDVTLAGAFDEGAEVRISAYNHSSWGQFLPVGKGTIHSNADEAWVDGQFFLDTEMGMQHYRVVKNLDTLAEFSYGFDVLDSEEGQWNGQDVRFLKKLKVFEVSPVLLGAGINTRLESIKERDPEEGMTFVDNANHALGVLEAFTSRAEDLGALRAAKGTGLLGEDSSEAVEALLLALDENAKRLSQLLATSARSGEARMRAARARYEFEAEQRQLAAIQQER